MITKLTGRLVRVLDDEVRVAIPPYEYQVLVPESVRRLVQMKTGEEITFHISQYYEGNSVGSRFIPRMIGFLTESELEFFDLFCTVDKIGVKKALKALARSPRDIANAIVREDAKWLATLPGIGATTAEQIVSTLKRKVGKHALAGESGESVPAVTGETSRLVEDIYQALLVVGLGPAEARSKLDGLLKSGQKFQTVEDGLTLIYSR
jgi:holliday junction DNA helicase RuvA